MKKYLPLFYLNTLKKKNLPPAFDVNSCSTSGRLVTTPVPRGKKSLKSKWFNVKRFTGINIESMQ